MTISWNGKTHKYQTLENFKKGHYHCRHPNKWGVTVASRDVKPGYEAFFFRQHFSKKSAKCCISFWSRTMGCWNQFAPHILLFPQNLTIRTWSEHDCLVTQQCCILMPATKFIGALAVFKTPVSGLAYGIVLLGIWGLSSSIVRLRANQPVQ